MFCWLYFDLPLSSVKNLKQKVFLDQFCLSKWPVGAVCQNDDNEDSKKVKCKGKVGLNAELKGWCK